MNNAVEQIEAKVLEATYRTNMECFKQTMPDLFAYLINYQPKQQLLGVDDYGQYNLFTGKNWVYPEKMDNSIREQLELFRHQPIRFVFSHNSSDEPVNHYFLHTYYLDKLSQIFESIPEESRSKTSNFAPLFVMLGVGIGKHLDLLMHAYDMQALYIYEPNPDVFYASLFVTDYVKLVTTFVQAGKPINIQLGQSWGHFLNGVSELVKSGGYYIGGQVYLYCHYNSEEITLARTNLQKLIHRVYAGLGFYEDELISINHTFLNVKEGFPVMLKNSINTCFDKDVPIFVVGNGPSLDYSFDVIKKNKDKAIIISCSSSLGVLLKNDIVPDIHVETERGVNVAECLELIEDTSKLKDVTLIMLNTIHQRVPKFFKNTYIAMKTNDVGTAVIKKLMPEKFRILECCNPTSGNGAASVAVNLGFKRLFLFGLDFGAIDEKSHHSKGSFYFDETTEYASDTYNLGMETTGNFRETVKTNNIWDMANFAMEKLIKDNQVLAFNTSDGAKIDGVAPLYVDGFPDLGAPIDKEKFFDQLEQIQTESIPEAIVAQYDSQIKRELAKTELIVGGIIESLKIVPNDKKSLFELMKIHKEIMCGEGKGSSLLQNLVIGSVGQVHLRMCAMLLKLKDDIPISEYVEQCFGYFKAYLLSCLEVTRRFYQQPSDAFDLEKFLKDFKDISK